MECGGPLFHFVAVLFSILFLVTAKRKCYNIYARMSSKGSSKRKAKRGKKT